MSLKLSKFMPVDEGGEELHSTLPDVTPVSVYFEYGVNELPIVKITVSSLKDKLYKFKQYKCIITFHDNYSTKEFDFFVEHIDEVSSSNTVLTGLMCSQKQATEYKSASLGDTIDEAISALGFKRDVISFDKPSVNFNYFQFNETANDALLKILVGNAQYGYGFITDKVIKTIDFSSLQKLDESAAISYTINSTDNELYVGNPYSVDTDPKDTEIEFNSYMSSKNKFGIHQASINGEAIIYDDNMPQELNAMCNRKFMGTLNKSFTIKLSTAIPGNPNIGDILLCKGFDEFNTSNKGFPAVITKHWIYESNSTTSYVYRVERT